MKAQDIRKLTAAQIEKKIAELKEELFSSHEGRCSAADWKAPGGL